MAQSKDLSAVFPDFSLLPIFMQSPSFVHLLPKFLVNPSLLFVLSLTSLIQATIMFFVCAERAPFLLVLLSTMELVIVPTGKSDHVTLC